MTLAVVNGLLVQHVVEGLAQAALSGGAGAPLLAAARERLLTSSGMSDERKRQLLAIDDDAERARSAARPAAPAASAAPAVAAVAAPLKLQLPFTTRDEAVTSGADRKYNSYSHAFAGMGVQFILFMGIDLGVGLLLARRLGLWKRLRAAPLSRAALIGARMTSGALIALVLLLVIFAAAMALFHVRIDGSVVGFAGVAVAFALLTASFGLLIAALGKTPEATRGLAVFVTLLLVMLSGAWVPSFVFPEWLQTVSLFVPTRWAIDGLDAMTWRGLGAGAALAPIGVMLAFSAAFAGLALWRFDWEE
jgi:ABC-2 type transport system permease protein